MHEDDFVILGYMKKPTGVTSILLGQYMDGALMYQGHVTLGVSPEAIECIQVLPPKEDAPCPVPAGNRGAIWVAPQLVCHVQYLERTPNGSMRQPIFRSIQEDKQPQQCIGTR